MTKNKKRFQIAVAGLICLIAGICYYFGVFAKQSAAQKEIVLTTSKSKEILSKEQKQDINEIDSFKDKTIQNEFINLEQSTQEKSILKTQQEEKELNVQSKEDKTSLKNENSDKNLEMIAVYVCGAVKNPGVYYLEEETRQTQAIKAAGGALENAALEVLNLAGKINDEQRIFVPTKEEAAKDYNKLLTETISQEIKPETNFNLKEINKSAKIDINSASVAELTELPGIGIKRAETIVENRKTNGNFSSIEDLQRISGIKGAVFEKIKELIEVNE